MCDILTAVFMRCDRLPDILAQVRYLTWKYTGVILYQVNYSSVYKIKVTSDHVWYFNSCYNTAWYCTSHRSIDAIF